MENYMRLADLANEFEQSLRQRDLSPRTVAAYHWALNDLIEKAMRPARLVDVEHMTRPVLREWQDTQLEREWEPRTRGLASTAIRQFIKFGMENDYIIDAKLERALAKVKQPDPEPHPIPEAALEAIKAALIPYPQDSSIVALRDRALFFSTLSSGGRVSEILQMRVDNYEAPNIIQKGGSRKTLGMPAEAIAMVRDYLSVREALLGAPDMPELWLSHTSRTAYRLMTPSQVRYVWHLMSVRLGVDYWTTHEIRHSCATELLKAKVPHLVIANHMGHHGPQTIANYAKVLDEAKQEVLSVMGSHMRPVEVAA
jgi:site-specific recombinase XerD